MIRRKTKRAAFALVTLAVAVLGCEAVARVYEAVLERRPAAYGYPPDLFVAHPTLDFALRPRFAGRFGGRGYEGVHLLVNEDGYRDFPFAAPPDGRHPRMVFLGDSVTFGAGVEMQDRFSNLLAARAGGGYETLNLAVNAYTCFHYREQVREDVRRYDPDIVVIGFCLNDVAPRETSWPRRLFGLAVTRDLEAANREPRPSFGRRSATVRVLQRLAATLRPWDAQWAAWMRRVVEAWQNDAWVQALAADLRDIDSMLRAEDRRFVVLLLPEKNDLQYPGVFDLPRKRALVLLQSLGVQTVDLFPVFAPAGDVDGLYLAGDSVHFSPQGHVLAARALAAALAPGR